MKHCIEEEIQSSLNAVWTQIFILSFFFSIDWDQDAMNDFEYARS